MAPAADLPPGWETDLAVLRYGGSVIEDRGDHLLVRTPHNPGFHWGNLLFVTDEDAVNDGERWVQTFQAAIPDATWVAVGLIRMPDDPTEWVAQGLDVELDEVLTTRTLPRQTPLPEGYTVRRLDGDDWAQAGGAAPWQTTTGPGSTPRSPMRASSPHRRRPNAHCPNARSQRSSARSPGTRLWRASASCGAARRPATRASAPTPSTDVVGWPRTSSAWPHDGLPTMTVTDGSSSPRRPTRQAASTAASGFEPDTGNAQAYRNHRAEPRDRRSATARPAKSVASEGRSGASVPTTADRPRERHAPGVNVHREGN